MLIRNSRKGQIFLRMFAQLMFFLNMCFVIWINLSLAFIWACLCLYKKSFLENIFLLSNTNSETDVKLG
jgi:hypothetical protein